HDLGRPSEPVHRGIILPVGGSRCWLRRDRIVVVLEQKIFVYNFADLKLVHQIETISNPKGLCAVSHAAGSIVLVCPGLQKGQVRVEHYASKRTNLSWLTIPGLRALRSRRMGNCSRRAVVRGLWLGFSIPLMVRCCKSFLTALQGKGDLAKGLWNLYIIKAIEYLMQVRRGADRAEIYSLAFSSTAQWLAVSSDKGTVHVFGLKANLANLGGDKQHIASDANRAVSSPALSLSFMKGVLPKYFNSEWSVAQFRLVEGSQYIVAFGHQKNTVVILGLDGRCVQ
ncbi:hypothetical protein C3L33_07594, partial [Rhododendron williamsianum]